MFGGGSSYRKSVALDPALYEATRKLVARLRYTGVGMFEYKQDPSGAFVFIEINGRFWGSLPLAIAAGADFPAWLYDLLVHQRRHFPRDYRVGLFARNTQKDFDWLRENLRADKRDKRSPVLAALPLSVVAAETLNLLTRRECNDTLVGDDPAPGLKDLADIAAYAGRAAARIARRTFFSAALSLRIAEEQVRRRLQGARRVLFVCKGNICRSPFAEAVARRAWRGVEVASAGYYPERGRASPASAVAVAGELGIDLVSHRSRILDQTMLSAADVVLVFDEENLETVERRFPYARSKLFRLGALDRAVPGGTIADPYGGTEEAFRVTYEQIHRAIDAATGIFEEAPRPARVVPMSGALED
jgi:protein-tyrosine-phosphatase